MTNQNNHPTDDNCEFCLAAKRAMTNQNNELRASIYSILLDVGVKESNVSAVTDSIIQALYAPVAIQNNELDLILDKFHKSKPDDTPTYNLYHEQPKQAIEALYAPKEHTGASRVQDGVQDVSPKPVENGELDQTLQDILGYEDWKYTDKPYRIEQLLAQEKAKWVSEVDRIIGEDENDRQTNLHGRLSRHPVLVAQNKLRAKQRQALAKLLDKENV